MTPSSGSAHKQVRPGVTLGNSGPRKTFRAVCEQLSKLPWFTVVKDWMAPSPELAEAIGSPPETPLVELAYDLETRFDLGRAAVAQAMGWSLMDVDKALYWWLRNLPEAERKARKARIAKQNDLQVSGQVRGFLNLIGGAEESGNR